MNFMPNSRDTRYSQVFDLRSGYYHIGLSDSAKPKSAFVLSSLGKYQFNRVPFGLAQVPAYFQKLINDILKGCNFHNGLPWRHYHLQQNRKRTLRALGRNIR